MRDYCSFKLEGERLRTEHCDTNNTGCKTSKSHCELQQENAIWNVSHFVNSLVAKQNKNYGSDNYFCFLLSLSAFFVGVGFLLLVCCSERNVFAGDIRRLTDDGQLKFAPVFTNKGKAIVYSVRHHPQRVVLMRLNVSDGTGDLVLPNGMASQFDPDYSHDGRYLCYSRSGFGRQLSLVIVDTSLHTEFAFDPPGTSRSTTRTPRFLPNSDRIIFTLNGTRGQQIASVNLQGQDPQHLTESGGINAWPAVSPDGKRVVFSSSRDGAFNLYLMDVDGHNVLRLTNSPTSDIHASWSPSGKHIAFTSLRDRNYEIYVLQADGTNLKRVTQHPERDDFAVWHPDGKHLLTVAERKGKFDLYLSRLEESLTSGGNSQ